MQKWEVWDESTGAAGGKERVGVKRIDVCYIYPHTYVYIHVYVYICIKNVYTYEDRIIKSTKHCLKSGKEGRRKKMMI
jgi:hypothetical protein